MKFCCRSAFSFLILLNIQLQLGLAQPIIDSAKYGLPVLPEVSGFGLDSKGGQGGKIIVVSNLNSEGKGSLAEAINTSGPRIIVFEVAGYIDLEEQSLELTNPFITIVGQTAPSPGVTLVNGGLSIKTHDVIIQHIKVRPGDRGRAKKSGWEADGLASNKGAYNVIVDHCSFSWATDENLSVSGPRFDGENVVEWRNNTSHKITYSHCIIAQGLSNSSHSKGEHSKGTLVHDNATDILIYGNLYSSNVERSPLIKGGVQCAIVNNYIYNPGNAAIHYNLSPGEWMGHEWVEGKMSVEGNYIEFGKNSSENIAAANLRGPIEIYWKDNFVSERKINGEADESLRYRNTFIEEKTATISELLKGANTKTDGLEKVVESPPIWPYGLVPIPVEKVKDYVLQNAGAFPWDRDKIDRKIIDDIISGKGQIIDSETQVGGYPEIELVFRKFRLEDWSMTTLRRKVD